MNVLHAQAHLVVLQVLLIGVVELLSTGRVVDGVVQGISEVHHVRVYTGQTGSDGGGCGVVLLLETSQVLLDSIQH